MKKVNFIVVSPRQSSGGAIMLHLLCNLLQDKGYKSKMFFIGKAPKSNQNIIQWWGCWFLFCLKDLIKICTASIFPKLLENNKHFKGYIYKAVKGCKRKLSPFLISKNTIVIYPEIVYGNFLNAKNVVRWFLYHNHYKNDCNAFGKNDLFFAYRTIFNDEKLNPQHRLLFLSFYDSTIYKQYNFGKRTGKCYIIRKGNNRLDIPKSFDGLIIDNYSEKKIAQILNECEFCISYDTQTFYTQLAVICGCISIVIPEKGKNKNDYISSDDVYYGVSYSEDSVEIEKAKNERSKVFEMLMKNKINNDNNVKSFIEVCLNYFY